MWGPVWGPVGEALASRLVLEVKWLGPVVHMFLVGRSLVMVQGRVSPLREEVRSGVAWPLGPLAVPHGVQCLPLSQSLMRGEGLVL